MRCRAAVLAVTIGIASSRAGAEAGFTRLDTERYLDKCKGAWAGQMAGVMFGMPYEWAPGCEGFRFTGEPVLEELEPPWKPERIHGALNNDDLHVETTWLKALEEHGLDITPREAGIAFARTTYDLWHANLFGRENVRLGLMPPKSGHPRHTLHADDLDFQIESDVFGLISPGLPRESNRFCDIFGHIMCYGDGVYGGMFMAGMHTAAFFEDENVRAVIEAGLACIPKKSLYHQCISDVLMWYDENPAEWLATWQRIEDTWQDNRDCEPFWDSNMDAKLMGAYVTLALLYGNGDMDKTIELAVRCGQDADCNASSAGGVLGCMKGFRGIDPKWTSGLAEDQDKKYPNAEYTFMELLPACQRMAETNLVRAGGRIEADSYLIPRQSPRPPRSLEQWDDQRIPVLED